MTDLQDLIARVEAATESSVDLFYAVASGLLPDTFPSLIDHDHERVCWRVNVFGKFVSAGAWTDAALALVEQVLPGCGIKLHIENGRGLYGAVATILEPPTKWGEYQHEEFGKTPTLALLAALLSALIARDGAGYGTASTPGNSGRPSPQIQHVPRREGEEDPRTDPLAYMIYRTLDVMGVVRLTAKQAMWVASEVRAALPQPGGWRPIETAPTNETVLVAGGDAEYPVTASWTGLLDEPWCIDGQSDVHGEIGWPTLWQPLPPVPTDGGNQGLSSSSSSLPSAVYAPLPVGSETPSPAGDETAWLIEETWSGHVHYVHRDFQCSEWAAECRRDDARRAYGLSARMRVPIVTKNVDEAMRFPTRDAAELWKGFQPNWLALGEQYQVREHMWPPSSEAQPLGSAERQRAEDGLDRDTPINSTKGGEKP